MVTAIIFSLFYFFIYLIGRGFTLLFLKLNKFKVSQYQISKYSHFYPIIGLFIFGEFKLIFNFFTEMNFYTLFIILLGLFGNKYKTLFTNENIGIQSVTAFILGISSNTVNFSYDAGLYHLNAQGWLNESKIIFGLTNLHSRYGYSSFIEYINSNTWVFNNFLFQHFTNLIFIVSFFTFLYKCLFSSDYENYKIASLLLVAFGFLDNFGINGGRNGFIDIEAIGKQDTPFAVSFFFLITYLAFYLLNKKEEKKENFFIVLFLFLLSVQLRVFALSIAPIIFLLLIKEIFINKPSFKYKLNSFFLILLGTIWVVKNFIISSCLFYPVSFTCVPYTSWFDKTNAIFETNDLKSFHIAFDFVNESIFSWFETWSQVSINNTISINFLISFFILLAFSLIFTSKKSREAFSYKFLLPLYLFLVWLISSPSIRMGLAIFIISIFNIGIQRTQLNSFFDKKYILYTLFFTSLILLPRLDSYTYLVSSPFEIRKIAPPTIDYYDQSVDLFWGVRPEQGDQCWINLDCVPGPIQISEDSFLTYRVFKKIQK